MVHSMQNLLIKHGVLWVRQLLIAVFCSNSSSIRQMSYKSFVCSLAQTLPTVTMWFITPWGAFALQTMLVPINLVKSCLLCLQTMPIFLITRFGMTKKSYGGTPKNIFMGFVQGSGGASSAWLAVCTLVVCVCKHAGHGSTFQSAWSGLLSTVATILYVNNA